MYLYAGCYNSIQKITGDAYHRCFSLGVNMANETKNGKPIKYWTWAEVERIKQLRAQGFKATAIAKIMGLPYLQVRAKVWMLKLQREKKGGEC